MYKICDMKAIVRTKAGKEFSTMKVEEITAPTLEKNEVRINMRASRINPVDMDLMKGFPSLKYKNPQIGGIDGAGEIVELGKAVTHFEIGDAVYFYRMFSDIGTWAEEITILANHVAKIPAEISTVEAGSVALPLLTALESIQSLEPEKGKSILIHGAGGGVGFMAVQIAKKLGLEIIANGGSRDEDALKEIGVLRFINYKNEDFSAVLKNNPPDYVFDVIGKENLLKSILLKPKKVVSIALPDPSKMHKSGVKLPWIFNQLMNLMSRKFKKAAQKNKVELIGQVTGANGALLAEAAQLFSSEKLIVRSLRTIELSAIERKGLHKSDLGKTILF